MSDPLIERVAAAVAPAYRELLTEDCAGLLLTPDWYEDVEGLAPLALELTEVDEFVDRDGYQEELGYPELDPDPATFALCEELTRRIVADDDGYVLVEVYFLALARHMHEVLGIPVLVHEAEMPIEEQLRRQLATRPDADPLAVAFALAAPTESWKRDDGWAAVLHCDGFAVTVQRGGAPPDRLDFASMRQ